MSMKTYKIEDAAGVAVYRAVVYGAAEGGCKKPTAAGEGKFCGITQQAQATQNRSVPVKDDGISFAVASGVIAYGDAVYVGDNTGKVASCQTALAAGLANPASVLYVIGFAETAAGADGDIIKVRIQPFVAPLAVS